MSTTGRRAVALLAIGVACCLSVAGAQSRPSGGLVSGVVRDAVTKAPIAGARVLAAAFNHEFCHPCLEFIDSASVNTDGRGRFRLEDAPETFVLAADHEGYAVGGFGVRRPFGRAARIDLPTGQHLADLEILLFREAVIRGRVTDESGKPVADEEVWVSRIDASGTWRYQYRGMEGEAASHGVTDARGYYTTYAAPGRYAVNVFRRDEPTFHPSAPSIREAVLITLEPGEVRNGVDIRLGTRQAGDVRARFSAAGASALKFGWSAWLLNERIEIQGYGQDGTVQFKDVPYGDYRLEGSARGFSAEIRTMSPEWWAQAPVRVDASHVGPIDIVARPPLQLSGTVMSHGGATAVSTGIELQAVDDDLPCGRHRSRAAIAKDGAFRLSAAAGEYRLCTWPADRYGWAKATLNGRDLGDIPFVLDRDLSGIEVAVTETPARVNGSVRDSSNRPVREGWVVAFPADRSLWSHARKESGRFAAVRVTIGGTFEIEGLLPAEYLIAAVDDPSIDAWPDETWLGRAAESAQPVAVRGERALAIQPMVVRSIASTPRPPRVTRRMVRRFDSSFFGASAVPTPAAGFALEGTVREVTGEPAVRATVTARLRNAEGWFVHSGEVVTDRNGHYRLGGLPSGLYVLTAEGDVPFRHEPMLVQDGRVALPMVVTDLRELEKAIDRNQQIDFRLERIRRPHFAGWWTMDARRSSITALKYGSFDPGSPAASLQVYHKEETINWGENHRSVGPIYRTNGSSEPILFGAPSSRVEVRAVSHWQDERLVTVLTLAASMSAPEQALEENRWLDTDGTMIVELRSPNGSLLRRTVYRKDKPAAR